MTSDPVADRPAPRLSPAGWTALALLALGLAADTATTLAGGAALRAQDVNPLIRGLGAGGYLAWSAVRLALGATLLLVVWPGRRERRISLRAVPALLVAAIGPLRLVAAASNLWLLQTGAAPFAPGLVLIAGGALGLLTGGLLLRWHYGRAAAPEAEPASLSGPP